MFIKNRYAEIMVADLWHLDHRDSGGSRRRHSGLPGLELLPETEDRTGRGTI